MRHHGTFDRKPRRGLAQPVPVAAGAFTSLWGIQANRFGSSV